MDSTSDDYADATKIFWKLKKKKTDTCKTDTCKTKYMCYGGKKI